MSITHILENFGDMDESVGANKLISEVAIEDQRLTSFEQGYSAGWEDAISLQSKEHVRLSSSLVQSMQEISFSYHEALEQMLFSVEPVFRALVELALPEIMHKTLGHSIVEHLKKMACTQMKQPVELVVPAGVAAVLRPVLNQKLSVSIRLREDPSLGEGQVQFHFGKFEQELNTLDLLKLVNLGIESLYGVEARGDLIE